MKETKVYDQSTDSMMVTTVYDREPVLRSNHIERAEFSGYKKDLVKVASLAEGDVLRLRNMGYDLLSPDPEEARRVLLYIQQNEPHLLTVTGKPFAKVRPKWR